MGTKKSEEIFMEAQWAIYWPWIQASFDSYGSKPRN